MNNAQLKTLIKEVVKETLNEELTSLTHLHDGVSTSTLTGKAWFRLISDMETLMDEVKDFPDLYHSATHGPTPNTGGALIQLQLVVKLLQSIKPVIIGMDDIEKKDV